MGFDAKAWRSERLRLFERSRANIDTALWLRGQAIRALQHAAEVMQAIDRSRSERVFESANAESGQLIPSGQADPKGAGQVR
jgi:hypothetical protein